MGENERFVKEMSIISMLRYQQKDKTITFEEIAPKKIDFLTQQIYNKAINKKEEKTGYRICK